MLYPSINKIRTKADSRYTLVILAAKRARDIIEGIPKLTEEDSHYAFVMPEDEERITLNVTFVDEIIVGLSDAACPFGFRYTDGRTVWLSGIDESVPISIYDARGTMVSARVARTPDTAVIHLDELPAGLYIISVNHQSYKIQKK